MTEDRPIVYDEWRLTADHRGEAAEYLPPYDFTWSERLNPQLCVPDAESAARAHAAQDGFQRCCENIRLWHRTVTVSPWSEDRS